MKSKKATKQDNSQKKILFVIAVLTIILIIGYIQKPTTEEPQEETPPETQQQPEPTPPETPAQEPIVEEPEAIPEEPTTPKPTEEEPEECTIGFKCLDENRRGYQSSSCMFNQVDQCDYGCKDGECIEEAPPETSTEEEFSLTQGTLMMNKTGWKYTDFDKEEIFIEEINEYDFKIKLYSPSLGRNYFRASSYRSDLWLIEKTIEEATRADCMENIDAVNAYINLITSHTLCMETRDKGIALVGANWGGSPQEDTKITWKYYR